MKGYFACRGATTNNAGALPAPSSQVSKLGAVLQTFQFTVDSNQREYQWETADDAARGSGGQRAQATRFLAVLDNTQADDWMFLGAIVLHDRSTAAGLLDQHGQQQQQQQVVHLVNVIDGQQRLVTILLILAAVHRGLSELAVAELTQAELGSRSSLLKRIELLLRLTKAGGDTEGRMQLQAEQGEAMHEILCNADFTRRGSGAQCHTLRLCCVKLLSHSSS